MTSDWEYELGLVKVKTKEIWELEGRCGDECCYRSPSASQIAKRVQANHTVKLTHRVVFATSRLTRPIGG